MSLAERLKRQIVLDGPITVASFMHACLHDPQDGYYATRPSLGAAGDFVTAPLVSQMFGELLGLWAAQVWIDLGRPAAVRLVELGPGDGALLHDALRAGRSVPGFLQAVQLWLVEPSAPLKALQLAALGPAEACWADRLADVPTGAPTILLANEVFDCLPARQFVKAGQGWAERRIGLDDAGDLVFGLAPASPDAFPQALDGAPAGAVLELSSAQDALAAEIGMRIAQDGGAALVVDYGRSRFGFGDTLQAVKAHGKVCVLAEPGEADMTVHVDFPALARAAEATGARTTPILTQGEFLVRLGVQARAEALVHSRPDQHDIIARQLDRLIGPDEMGTLFKVFAIHQDGLQPPGFEAV